MAFSNYTLHNNNNDNNNSNNNNNGLRTFLIIEFAQTRNWLRIVGKGPDILQI